MVTLKNDDVVEGRGDGAAAGSGPARELVDGLAASGALDSLFERIDRGDIELTGDGGLIPELVRTALERGLEAEMTSHLGYGPGDRAGKEANGAENSRNGSYPKTLATEVGPVTIQVPRDREGSFTPRLVPKCSRRLGGLDDMIVSLYAGGMTVRDIGHHLAKTVGTELSHETVSSVTDAVADAVLEWQERPLDEFYPVMYLDAIRVKVRDGGGVVSKAAHIAIGVDMDGLKHVLGIWVQDSEGSSFRGERVRADGQQGRHGRAGRVLRRVEGPARGGRGHVAAGDGADLRGASGPRGEQVRGRPRPQEGVRRVEGRVRGGGRGPGPQTARRVQARRARPQIPVGGGHVGAVHAVPAVPAHVAARDLHDQQHRIVELPAQEGQPQPQPVPQRPGCGQAPVARDLRHRGQTRQATGEGGQGQAPQRRVPAHRGQDHHQLETGPRPTRRRIPGTHGTIHLKNKK